MTSRVGPQRRALFVDRDGTLIPDLHYLKEHGRVELFRGVGDALALAHRHDFLVVCVTNQSGVERGFYSDDDVARMHERLNVLLRSHGTQIDAFYYCPHTPEQGCACRKPGTLLFERARDDLGIDVGASAIVGDRALDIEAGHRIGLLTALAVGTNHRADAERELRERDVRPEIVAPSFATAVLRVLARG